MKPTKDQWLAFLAAWTGWVLDAFDFTIFLLVMPQIAKHFGTSNVATAGSIALTLLARLVGGFVAGAAADKWGRRLPLLVSVVWFALCDGAVAFAPSFAAVLVLRTLFGFGMGAEWTSGATLAMESWPKKTRGIASGVLQGSWAIGYLLAAVVFDLVMPRWGWRAMFVIAALPALLAIPMRFWVKESPELEARLAHEKMAFPLARAFREDKTLLRRIVWGCAVMALGFGAYNGLTVLYPTMLQTELGQDTHGVFVLVALFNIGMMAGSVAVGVLASKRGASVALAVPCTLAALAIPLYTGFVGHSLGAGALLGGAIGCGMVGATPLLLTSLFPAEVRGRLVGIVYHVGAALAAVVPMAMAAFARATGASLAATITIVTIACELAIVACVVKPGTLARAAVRGAPAALVVLVIACMIPASTGGCLVSNALPEGAEGGAPAAATVAGDDPTTNDGIKDAIPYRDLASHPGCTADGLDSRKALAYTNATIPGYRCAAKAYPVMGTEDTKKPIVLLVHGNSSTPADFETFSGDMNHTPMLSERLVAAGYRVVAVDVRYDKVDDPGTNNDTENAAKNFDHGWAVPIVQHFIESMMAAFPDRHFEAVAFSVGPTVVRDAMRRLHHAGKKPFERFDRFVFVSGGNHGVSSFRKMCGKNPTMRGVITCELGDLAAYTPTVHHAPLNGPGGAWETPCVDGDTAFGQKGVCGGHKVAYYTLVMHDTPNGPLQDEFVSQTSAMLNGAENDTVALSDIDQTGYFYNGLFKNHYGALRSETALTKLMAHLTAPPP